jgi:hypothetical protein
VKSTRPSPTAPLPESVLALHDEACDRSENGYIDPSSGFFVMTSFYLASQGRCCGNGCRHCPWPSDTQVGAGRPVRPAWPYRGVAPWMPGR